MNLNLILSRLQVGSNEGNFFLNQNERRLPFFAETAIKVNVISK